MRNSRSGTNISAAACGEPGRQTRPLESEEILLEDNKFALLIDSDNISARYIDHILSEMTKYGVTTYKRIYGDWTSPQTAKWREELLKNSIIPIQQFSNTVGKNATDSALIIDAMDILYTNSVDGFCIVSSDGDFTRLASRLRESGMVVIGMGEEKTPRSFRAACSIFTSLELLLSESDSGDEPAHGKILHRKNKQEAGESRSGGIVDKHVIECDAVNIITENENKGKMTGLGELGSRLQNKYPDFDVRNYGYSLLSKFLGEMHSLELVKDGHTVAVRLKDSEDDVDEVEAYIRQLAMEGGDKGVSLSELSNALHARYDQFSVRDYGYSQFSKFVQSVWGVELGNTSRTKDRVFYRPEE